MLVFGLMLVVWFSVMFVVFERFLVNGLLIVSVKLLDLFLCVLVSSVEVELKVLLWLVCVFFEFGVLFGVV